MLLELSIQLYSLPPISHLSIHPFIQQLVTPETLLCTCSVPISEYEVMMPNPS